MSDLNEMKVIFDYCFNEFLKMTEFLQGEMQADKKKFLKFVLYVFEEKINHAAPEQLNALAQFPFPETPIQQTHADD
jgi:hypothetical protein